MNQQKFPSNVIEKSLAFGGPVGFQPANSNCETALLQELTVSVTQEKWQVDIPDKSVKYLLHSLMLLCEHKHHEIYPRGKGVPYGLIKEIVKRFEINLVGLKTSIPWTKIFLDTICPILFSNRSRVNNQSWPYHQ
jgi:hypothetical protein